VRPLLLVDVHALAARAHRALPAMPNAQGAETSALYGLAATLIKLLGVHRPRATAAALDGGEVMPPDVRAPRSSRPAPPALRRQLSLARALVEALGFHTFVVPGWGAKDVLATLAARLGGPEHPALLVGSELDLLQVIRPGVTVLLLGGGEGRLVGPTEVMIRMGVPPALLAEREALIGNAAAAGVPGVGPRTASRLLLRYGSLEGLLRRLGEVNPPRVRAAIAASAAPLRLQAARLRLRTDVPLCTDERALAMDWSRLEDGVAILDRLGFRALLPRLRAVMGGRAAQSSV
jgi:DNA polymerase-1